MVFYKVKVKGEDARKYCKGREGYFDWIKLPPYFDTDEYSVYLTMYGIGYFVDHEFIELTKGECTPDDFEYEELEVDVYNQRIIFQASTYIVWKEKDDLEMQFQ